MNTKKITLKKNKHSYKSTIVKFGFLYKVRSLKHKILLAIGLGIFYSFCTTIFIKNTSLYAGGTSSFFYGIARLTRTLLVAENHLKVDSSEVNLIYNALFWGLYLLMNIPLFIVAYKKISKSFAIISFVFVATDRLCGFGWSMIPNMTLDIFGGTENINSYLHDHYRIDTIILSNNIMPDGIIKLHDDAGGTVIDPYAAHWHNPVNWIMVSNSSSFAYNSSVITDQIIRNTFGASVDLDVGRELIKSKYDAVSHLYNNANYVKTLSLFFYATIFSLISATLASMLFIMGGSSAGSDFITVLYSVKKHKDIGKIYTIINASFLIIGCILGNYVSGIVAWNDIKKQFDPPYISGNPFAPITYFFSSNLLMSLVWIITNGILIGILFPSKRIVKAEVSSKNSREIQQLIFNNKNYIAVPINNPESSGNVKFLCSYFDYISISKDIDDIDKNAIILSSFVHDVKGPFDLYKNNFS